MELITSPQSDNASVSSSDVASKKIYMHVALLVAQYVLPIFYLSPFGTIAMIANAGILGLNLGQALYIDGDAIVDWVKNIDTLDKNGNNGPAAIQYDPDFANALRIQI